MIEFDVYDRFDYISHITVVDIFTSHFTSETMRYIRVETLDAVRGRVTAYYDVVNEQQWEELLAKRRDA